MVERQLLGEGTSREKVGRQVFNDRVWQWKTTYGNAILDQMKRLGASVDWSREYFTMDDRLSVAVREAFVRLYDQGLIISWRAHRQLGTLHSRQPSPTLRLTTKIESASCTASATDCLDGPLADGTDSIVIATTRPETLPGDVAVVVNPSDERYTKLIGKLVILPLSATQGAPDRQIPILADEWGSTRVRHWRCQSHARARP